MFILIEGGDPAPRGRQSILLADEKIQKIGAIDQRGLDVLDVDLRRPRRDPLYRRARFCRLRTSTC